MFVFVSAQVFICICMCSGFLRVSVEVIVFLVECVQVFSVSQLKCRRKKKLVRLWHKPTPGKHAGSNEYKRYYTL